MQKSKAFVESEKKHQDELTAKDHKIEKLQQELRTERSTLTSRIKTLVWLKLEFQNFRTYDSFRALRALFYSNSRERLSRSFFNFEILSCV